MNCKATLLHLTQVSNFCSVFAHENSFDDISMCATAGEWQCNQFSPEVISMQMWRMLGRDKRIFLLEYARKTAGLKLGEDWCMQLAAYVEVHTQEQKKATRMSYNCIF